METNSPSGVTGDDKICWHAKDFSVWVDGRDAHAPDQCESVHNQAINKALIHTGLALDLCIVRDLT